MESMMKIVEPRLGRFIIDPDGIVQGFEVLTPTVVEMYPKLLDKLKPIN